MCPTGGLGSPTGGLYKRTDGIFRSNRAQYLRKNFLKGIQIFLDGELALSDERATPVVAEKADAVVGE